MKDNPMQERVRLMTEFKARKMTEADFCKEKTLHHDIPETFQIQVDDIKSKYISGEIWLPGYLIPWERNISLLH